MPRDNRCMSMAHVCLYVCCSDCVETCGNVCCVAAVGKDRAFQPWSVEVCLRLCNVCDGCCVFCLYCDAWRCRCSCMGNMSVVMHMLYIGVLCAFCGSSQCYILHDLQFVNAGRGCRRRPYGRRMLQSRSNDCIVQVKALCRYGCMYFLAALVLVCVDVVVMSST